MKNSEMPILYNNQKSSFYIDIDGTESQHFWYACGYYKGFADVCPTFKTTKCRDLLGRLTDNETRSGKIFYKFFIEEISLKDIDLICFADEIFCEGVKKELIRRQQARAKELFQKGQKVSKSKVKREIEHDFSYIEHKHKKASTLLTRKIKTRKTINNEKKETKKQPDYSQQYNETKDYLDSLIK